MAKKLELVWEGKEQPIKPEPRIFIENPKLSNIKNDSNTENILIHGDNLLAIKALENKYKNKIKCVYIDPPYNTGSAFEHYDDNFEHSTWLNLIKPRIELLRNLLTDDGSIWISIDDDEQAYMKVLCDEIFGRNNFVANIIWQKRTSPDMRLPISTAHDYILVYAKSIELFKPTINKLPLSEETSTNYKNPDNDPRGVWTSTDCTAQAGHATKEQFYDLKTPSGRIIKLPSDRCWRYTEKRMNEQIADNRIWFGKDGNGVPRKKTFLSESKGMSSWTWWPNKEVGHNQEAKKEVIAFNKDSVFATPKPERLIQRILTLATNEGDYVLDSFLGSGTTAAVAHKMGRKWIGIEMGNHVYTHCKPRLDKVIEGTDKGGITKSIKWLGGGGYHFYELAPTLIVKNEIGIDVINKEYNAEQLAAAIALHEGYIYQPDETIFWKQSKATENSYLFVTTSYITPTTITQIEQMMNNDEYLLIACKAFDSSCEGLSKKITIKKIPQMLLKLCEFGKDDYSLNIVNPPIYVDEECD